MDSPYPVPEDKDSRRMRIKGFDGPTMLSVGGAAGGRGFASGFTQPSHVAHPAYAIL